MASRKSSSRSRRNAKKPAVIDATATEVDSESAEAVAGQDIDQAKDAASASEDATAENGGADDVSIAEADGSETSAEDAPKSDAPDSEAAPARKSSGRGKWIAAGLAAILLSGVAGGGYLYRTYGERFFGAAGTNESLAAMETQVMDATGAAQSAREAAEAVTGKVDELRQRIDGLEKTLQQAASTPDPALSGAVSKAQETADTARAATDELSGKATALEARVGELQGAVDSLQKALDEAAKSGGSAEQAAVSLKLEELARKVDAVEASASQAASPGTAELDTLKQQLAANQQAIASLKSQVENLTSELTATTAKLAEAASAQPPATGLSEVGKHIDALENAVNAGTPFETELDRLRGQVSLPALPALTANAASGIPTVAQLEQRLGEIAATLKQPNKTDTAEPSGIWGMVQNKISSVVKVRSLDEPDWATTVTAAQQALLSGGLDGAVASLQDKSKDMPSQLSDWLVEARKRTAAQAELERLPQAVLSAAPAGGQSQ